MLDTIAYIIIFVAIISATYGIVVRVRRRHCDDTCGGCALKSFCSKSTDKAPNGPKNRKNRQ